MESEREREQERKSGNLCANARFFGAPGTEKPFGWAIRYDSPTELWKICPRKGGMKLNFHNLPLQVFVFSSPGAKYLACVVCPTVV